MEDLAGRQFGPYRVVAALGEGGMAAVYQAYQPAVDRYVALKVLSRQLAADPQFLHRFRHEAKVVAQLQHPHILPVFDFGESDGYSFLAMPFVTGGTLAELLKGEPLTLSRTTQIMGQICEALDYAHAKGVIHRDIKPSNILIDERQNCLVADFGLARIAEGATQWTIAGAVMGTPAYMSPEQAAGGVVGRASDIYSIGIVLYEMLTGRVPFTAETPLAVLVKHLTAPLPPPRTLNPALTPAMEAVILKALARTPEDRFSSAHELAMSLAAVTAATVQIHWSLPGGGGVSRLPDAPLERDSFQTVVQGTTGSANSGRESTRTVPIIIASVAAVLALASGVWFLHNRAAYMELPQQILQPPPTATAANNLRLVERTPPELSAPAAAVLPASAPAPANPPIATHSPSTNQIVLPPSGSTSRPAVTLPQPVASVPALPPRSTPSKAPAPAEETATIGDGPNVAFDRGLRAYQQKDLVIAADWFQKAAAQGHPRAQEYLGSMYAEGLGELPQDPVQAVAWYRKAADQGDAIAEEALGAMYVSGRGGLPRDPTQAVAWYRKAGGQGYGPAQATLGSMYYNGEGGLPKDPGQAAAWYLAAADNGLAVAELRIAQMYRDGDGVTKDVSQARQWLEKAAAQGNEEARKELATVAPLAKAAGCSRPPTVGTLDWNRMSASQQQAACAAAGRTTNPPSATAAGCSRPPTVGTLDWNRMSASQQQAACAAAGRNANPR